MRILHVIASIDPSGGGPQAVVVRLASAQARLGHRPAIAAYGDAEALGRARASAAGVPGLADVELLMLGAAGGLERVSGAIGSRRIAARIESSDFVHLHGIWEGLLPRAASIAVAAGTPYCVRPAGMLDPWSLGQKRAKKAIAMWLFQRRMLDGAAFLHMLNPDEERLVAGLQLRAPRVVIGNGVSLPEIDRALVPGRFRARHPQLGASPFVLFLSRLHVKKGLDVLAEIFAILAARRPDLHLVVAGPDGGYGETFHGLVEAAGLGPRVHVTGPLYGEAKFEALADAACFCLPSRQEGFSVAITEALASGVPAVISEGCHFPEVAEAGAGRVLPLAAPAFADAIEALLSDPATAAAMGRAGRTLVAGRFTWPRIAAETLDAYAAVARTGGRRAIAG